MTNEKNGGGGPRFVHLVPLSIWGHWVALKGKTIIEWGGPEL